LRAGAEALETSPASRPAPVRAEAGLRVAAPLLEAPVADRPNWTLTRLIGEIEAREGVTISKSRLSKLLRKKFRWRRPRHTLKGRQDADAIDRVGLRLALRKAQAEAGDIVLIFADESEGADASLSGQSVGQAWRRRSRVPAPGQAKKVAMLGALDHAARRLVVHTSKTKRSADFIALLGRLDGLYGPRRARRSATADRSRPRGGGVIELPGRSDRSSRCLLDKIAIRANEARPNIRPHSMVYPSRRTMGARIGITG
jgi:Winged helix-turn helix